ncbi:hypothetical protein KUCAC02_016906, partial [Chaenocephalus aceratus]
RMDRRYGTQNKEKRTTLFPQNHRPLGNCPFGFCLRCLSVKLANNIMNLSRKMLPVCPQASRLSTCSRVELTGAKKDHKYFINTNYLK